MASPRWSTDGRDLHLVAPVGQADRTFALGNFFLPDGKTPWTPTTPNWPAPFVPVFPFTKATHGVQVDSNGTLTFGSIAPVRNFIVNAVSGTTKVPIRIHRHDFLQSAELTPPSLTLHQTEGTQVRFSVLAVFTDDANGSNVPCVADISQHPGLKWARTSGTSADVTPDQSGFIVWLGQLDSGPSTFQLTLPADLLVNASPLPPLTGQIQLAPPWETPPQDALQPIAGLGFDQINDVPNVLILPDGFTDRTEFEKAATGIVNKIAGAPTVAPWNTFLAKKSNVMNCWMGWVPSPTEGGNDLNELWQDGGRAPFVTVPAEPTGSSITSLGNLIYRLGLPTMADGVVATFDAQSAIWKGLYSAAYLTGVTSALWAEWKQYAVRSLAREVDTTFGISIGNRPQLPPQSSLAIGLHPFRTARRDINKFLPQLFVNTAQGTVTVGQRWASGPDKNKIVILSKGPRERGTDNGNGVVAVSLSDRGASTPAVISQGVSALIDLTVPPFPAALDKTAATVTHELTHVYNAGDEYVFEGGLNLPADQVSGTQASYWNLIVDREARDQSGKLTIPGMRWAQWPRVAAANFVDGIPTITESVPFDHIRVQLNPGGTKPFQDALKAGKIDATTGIFRLRQGHLASFTGSGAAQVPKPITVLMSPPMKLVNIDATNAIIDLDEVTNGTLKPWVSGLDAFDPEPLRLLGVVMDATLGELTVMHPAIASHIVNHGTSGRPCNRPVTSGDQCVLDGRPVQPSDGLRDFPSLPLLPPIMSRLIGLYDGGAQFSCGVFHPAGTCIMRSIPAVLQTDPRAEEAPDRSRRMVVKHYCHVCRYMLVDQIAPSLHADFDLLAARDYPR